MRCRTVRWWLIACLVATLCAPAAAQRRAAPQRAGANAAVEKIAAAARDAGRLDEAIDLYRKGVAARPNWDEGWWYLATLLYDRDAYPEAASAFAACARLRPKSGLAWIMLGLCEYRLARYDDAAEHLVQGQKLGFERNDALFRVVAYHEGVLGVYRGEFEAALKRLDELAASGTRGESLVLALGLALLRLPRLPEQLDANSDEYKMIRQAGFAEYQLAQNNLQDAQHEFDRLVADYPTAPNVYYAYGRFKLMAGDDEAALEAFKKEIANSPTNALARMQLAFILLNRNQQTDALPFAAEAVRLYPRFAQAHFLYGRLLYDTGDNDSAIRELETAQQLAPAEPKVYYVLARAYDKAKRKEDARRARDTFTQLSKAADEAGRAPGVAAPAGDDKP